MRIHSYKCLNCDLHFNLYSWEELDKGHGAKEVTCPECHHRGGKKLHWVVESNKQIFQCVPAKGYKRNGISTLIEIVTD